MRVQKTATAQQNFQITYLPVSCLNEQNFKKNIFDIKKYGKKTRARFVFDQKINRENFYFLLTLVMWIQ